MCLIDLYLWGLLKRDGRRGGGVAAGIMGVGHKGVA